MFSGISWKDWLWSEAACVQILILPFAGQVASEQLLDLLLLPFPHMGTEMGPLSLGETEHTNG